MGDEEGARGGGGAQVEVRAWGERYEVVHE